MFPGLRRRRLVGRRLAAITRESYQLDAKMNATMTERFGVAGALLVKLFARPEVEAERFGLLGEIRSEIATGPRSTHHVSMREWLDGA